MLTDVLDNNSEKVMQCLYDRINDRDRTSDSNATALDLVKDKIINLFLDEVKAPYVTLKVDGHIETMFIKSQRFEEHYIVVIIRSRDII